jgi:DNA repair exonuclease SbcCD ATPase subunit
MKSVTFKSLKIQNFLSIGNDPVCIYFKEGINLITGQNKDKPDRRNAIGKSTIADGLYFAIFGEPLREIKKDLIVNNITGGTTLIELEFDVKTLTSEHTYTICRKNNPSKITISKDGVDVTRDTIANTNKYICDVLSATPAVFQNCVIMTVNGAIPFMAKNKIEKRKFIEDIFGLEVFSKMISELRNEINQVTKENEIEQTKFDEVNRSVFNYQKQKEKTLDHRKNKHATYLQRQEENEENIAKLEQKRDSMVFWNEQVVKETIGKIDTGIKKCD